MKGGGFLDCLGDYQLFGEYLLHGVYSNKNFQCTEALRKTNEGTSASRLVLGTTQPPNQWVPGVPSWE
jgi:hypothetical protein